MKIPKLAYAFILMVCIFIYFVYTKFYITDVPTFEESDLYLEDDRDLLYPSVPRTSYHVFYGIMFDAGSTGTRIHVFRFTATNNGFPKLANETFKALKPGLSAYADEPNECTRGIKELLDVAKASIPSNLWRSTPLVLKATAGLRLLPGEKAMQLLNKVTEVFQESPFFVAEKCVSIMDGTDEGIAAWITVNFLTGNLNDPRDSAGMLDLGGGSTQITFLPHSEKTLQTSPDDYITSFPLFKKTYTLYSHSYLGLGLMSARLAILGGTEGQPLKEDEELISPCLPPEYKDTWEHAEIVYKIKGQKAGEPMYESCYKRVEKMLYKKVHKVDDIEEAEFYAFSYYYDRAVDVGLIDEEKGGSLKVEDFEAAAKQTCKAMESGEGEKPFLCLDLTYITVLLQELGFPKNKVFRLARKINNVETSWALGATFHHLDYLHAL
ncbi:ectonucleoside triphosphate diphosphohydrolase 6 [Protopterus annectens]|uniref:ectonucleoside triphosphate diphosphohydrolase 6 n=1 Tax=Protopterus annectens TaxID=7888 RepID=UPI001CFAB0F1|nr:ectonucleoside triphosphate diphosphohydrolase 6 [Protopterus annectens]XP_043913643.1 ectonucleoside triphosphate diphosphohydrolase 6 [Protopterus annectens]